MGAVIVTLCSGAASVSPSLLPAEPPGGNLMKRPLSACRVVPPAAPSGAWTEVPLEGCEARFRLQEVVNL